MIRRIFNYISYKKYERKRWREIKAAFKDYVQLPEDLTMVFYTALTSKDVAAVSHILGEHPEAARSRDWESPAHPSERSFTSVTFEHALICAIGNMPIDTIKRMLDLGADVEARSTPYKCSALGLAARANDIPLMDLLLSYGADPRKITIDSNMIFFDALYMGAYDAAQKIIDLTGKPDNAPDLFQKMIDFFPLSTRDWKKVIHFMIDGAGMGIEDRNHNGETPLIVAVRYGEISEAVKELIARGADIHATDNLGRTALHWAAMGRNSRDESDDIVRALIAAGATPDITDGNGDTPLQLAYDMMEHHDDAFHLHRGIDTRILKKAQEDHAHALQLEKREQALKKAEQITKQGVEKPIRLIRRIDRK